jgi:hypothetical protein
MGHRALAVSLFAVIVSTTSVAFAHEVHAELAYLDIGEHATHVTLEVPIRQLALARQTPVGTLLRADDEELRAYVSTHLAATTFEGRPFETEIGDIGVRQVDDGDALVIDARFVPPKGASANRFVFRDDLVLSRVTSADVYVLVRSDVGTTAMTNGPEAIGRLHYQQRALRVDRPGPSTTVSSAWKAFALLSIQLGLFAAVVATLRRATKI